MMSEKANLLHELHRIQGYLISIPSWVPGSVNAYQHVRDLIQTVEEAHPACAFCRGLGYITNPDDLKKVPCYCHEFSSMGKAEMIENLKSAVHDLRTLKYPATYTAQLKIGWVLDSLEGEDREKD